MFGGRRVNNQDARQAELAGLRGFKPDPLRLWRPGENLILFRRALGYVEEDASNRDKTDRPSVDAVLAQLRITAT